MFHTIERFRNQVLIAVGAVDVLTGAAKESARRRAWWEICLQVIMSLSVAGAGLYVILSGNRYDAKVREWAAGWVGMVVGYWLR